MKSISLVVFWIALASCLFAQKEVIVKKASDSEKTVSVNVNDDNGQRTVTIKTEGDGDDRTIKWTDDGEIPDHIKKQLEDENIDIKILGGSDQSGGREIRIDIDDEVEIVDGAVHKKMIFVKRDDDGDVTELDWDGEGEMPAEMRELLDEHDIDISTLHEEHGDHDEMRIMKKRMRIESDERGKMRRKARREGQRMDRKEQREYKIITIDEDGNKSVNEWHSDGDIPEGMDEDDVRVFRIDGNRRNKRGNDFIFFGDDQKLSNAYMGAQIESTNSGALILDVLKDSPADKAGLMKNDIVQRINGARSRSMDDLLSILTYFDPNDEVELTVTRDGREKKLKMTLGKRPDAYR